MAMGKRRPLPKDFCVTLRTGAACWRLYSLPFDERQHAADEVERVAVSIGDLFGESVSLDIGFEDRVEDLVGRERVGVPLPGAEFG